MPQLIASTHPTVIMNLIGSKQVIYLTLILDWIGITHFSWLLGYIFRKFICCLKGQTDHKKNPTEVNAKDLPVKLDEKKGTVSYKNINR